MKLLNTYEDKDEAEAAAQKITGEKRLASERDSTETIYNLFGQPTWGNLYKLGMFNLRELKYLLERKKSGLHYDKQEHVKLIEMLKYAESAFDIKIPEHWKP